MGILTLSTQKPKTKTIQLMMLNNFILDKYLN